MKSIDPEPRETFETVCFEQHGLECTCNGCNLTRVPLLNDEDESEG